LLISGLTIHQLIDFGLYLSGSPEEKKKVADEVVKGFQTAGFIYLKNHGIPREQVSHVFGQSARFFAQSQPNKDALAWYSAEANRGYVTHGREKVSMADDDVEALRQAAPDLKESLEIGRDDEPQFPNMWPPQDESSDSWPSEFKASMLKFFTDCKQLHMQVMRSMAVGLGIEESWFDGYTDAGDNTLRLLHYPAVAREVFEKNELQVRAGAHTDYGKPHHARRLQLSPLTTRTRVHHAALPGYARWAASGIAQREFCGCDSD